MPAVFSDGRKHLLCTAAEKSFTMYCFQLFDPSKPPFLCLSDQLNIPDFLYNFWVVKTEMLIAHCSLSTAELKLKGLSQTGSLVKSRRSDFACQQNLAIIFSSCSASKAKKDCKIYHKSDSYLPELIYHKDRLDQPMQSKAWESCFLGKKLVASVITTVTLSIVCVNRSGTWNLLLRGQCHCIWISSPPLVFVDLLLWHPLQCDA